MGIGKSYAIFKCQMNSDKYTEQEKLQAIKAVLEMPTHNGITKDEIITAFAWLFRLTIEEDK